MNENSRGPRGRRYSDPAEALTVDARPPGAWRGAAHRGPRIVDVPGRVHP
ncbi:hypothetical protein [Streptomyces sp. x-19]